MIIRSLSKQEIEEDPYCIWNAFVDLLAMEEYEELSPEQRPAYLVFWYDSEVQNGGHLQYFVNRGTEQFAATIEALGLLGFTCQQQILREAAELWLSRNRSPIQTVQEYSDTALEDEFGSFDTSFYACSPNLQECLEDYLKHNQALFVRVT